MNQMTASKTEIHKERRRSWLQRAFRHEFVAREDGVTAVEFAMLAAPFFAIVAAILETAIVFLSSQVLDTAVDFGVRQLRTGQIQTSTSNTMTTFRNDICDYLYGLFDCSQLRISVKKVTNFASAATGYPIDVTNGDWTMTEIYTPGLGSDVVMVQVYYKWPTLFNFFNFDLSNTADGKRLLSSVRVFKNEPF